jgi:multidrug resistance protein, MATE family
MGPMTASSHAPTLRKLLALAWPIIVSRSSQTIVGFSDAAMVARLGEDALAATTAGALNTLALFILPMGIVFIVSSFASQLYGRGDHEGARRYGWYGVAVSAATQLVFFALAAATPSVVSRLGYTPAVAKLMEQYIIVRLFTGGAAVGLEALGNYYGGLGNTRLPMAAQILCMVLNVGLNWVFIFGHLGAPAMGVFGAALASALSTLVAFLALLGCFVARFGEEKRAERAKKPLQLAELGRMLRFGLPSGLNWFVEFAAFTFFVNVVMNGLGTTTLAGFMAAMQVNQISFMPAFGVGSACAILVGHAIGAKEHDHVPAIVGLSIRVTAAWQGFVGLLYLVAPRLCMMPFAPPGEEGVRFLDVGARILAFSLTWQLLDSVITVVAEALRAAGDTTFCAWVRAGVAWAVFVPGSYVSVRMLDGGIGWAVFWLVAYLGLLAVVLWWRFKAGAWRKLDLAGAEMPPV